MKESNQNAASPTPPRASGKYKQDYAYDNLRHAIISGVFSPEKLLVERELSEMLGVSRTPVREALRRLSSEGLVESHPGRGMFVTRITAEEIVYIYELKEALERMAVRLCIQRMTSKHLTELGRCLKSHEKAYKEQNFELTADMDLQFHLLLVEFARSPKIQEHAKTIAVQTRRFSQLAVYDTSSTLQFIQEHRVIYEAILKKDISAAEEAVSCHVASIERFQREKRNLFM